jgi:putative phosphoribosyl transferase
MRTDGVEDVTIAAVGVRLAGRLRVPDQARGVVLFAHGSGSSRVSRRNNAVAEVLRAAGLASLLMDLLTEAEDRDFERRFDIGLLTDRLAYGADWLARDPRTRELPLGLFGASTGAAAALDLAARPGAQVGAVVSRGGRPDLAAADVAEVGAPTLLIVGGDDREVLALNREVYGRLRAEKELAVIPGATHLFEEPGALEEVARLAAAWFLRHLGASGAAAA